MGICRKKRRFFGLSGSLHKLDHVLSDGGLDNRGGFERVWGGGPDGKTVSIQEGMGTPK